MIRIKIAMINKSFSINNPCFFNLLKVPFQLSVMDVVLYSLHVLQYAGYGPGWYRNSLPQYLQTLHLPNLPGNEPSDQVIHRILPLHSASRHWGKQIHNSRLSETIRQYKDAFPWHLRHSSILHSMASHERQRYKSLTASARLMFFRKHP